MNIDAIPLFSMLKGRLGYLNQREKLIAQNVANADTPGYAPKDLKAFTIPASITDGPGLGMVRPATTNPGHLSGGASTGGMGSVQWKVETGSDSETTLDGNKVVLEDQMTKMTEARMDYEAAVGFYQKAMDLLRMAARPPGRNA